MLSVVGISRLVIGYHGIEWNFTCARCELRIAAVIA